MTAPQQETQPTNTREDIAAARRDETDWASLTDAQRVRHLELEGFAVIPDVLDADTLEMIREEVDRLPTRGVDYSDKQQTCAGVDQTNSPTCIEQVANPKLTSFLTTLFGDDLICTTVTYSCSLPGHPGIAIHTDSQPYGSKIFGLQASSPVLARCLIYLDDLTPERSPLKVIPRSHLSMHADANPYNRFLNHPDEVMVCCKAGSAAIINQKIFHANYPNYSDSKRRLLAIAFRPAWAGPIVDVDDRDAEAVAKLPEKVKPYFASLNTRGINFDVPNRPDNLDRLANGISPSRWGQE